MAGDGCEGGSRKPLPIPTKAPQQADQPLLVEEEDGSSSEGEFNEDYLEGKLDKDPADYIESEEEDTVEENGESVDEEEEDEHGDSRDDDDGEEGNGEHEQGELPDDFYLIEAVRKKRVRQVGFCLITTKCFSSHGYFIKIFFLKYFPHAFII